MSALGLSPSALRQPEPVADAIGVPMQEALARASKLDFTQVKSKLQKKQGWAPELCDQVEDMYRKFLALHLHFPEKNFVPTPSVDEFWHRHLLFTRSYQLDCEQLFGFFLHHEPSTGTPTERGEMEEGFQDTLRHYQEQFGVEPRLTPADFVEVAGAHCSCHRCRCRCD